MAAESHLHDELHQLAELEAAVDLQQPARQLSCRWGWDRAQGTDCSMQRSAVVQLLVKLKRRARLQLVVGVGLADRQLLVVHCRAGWEEAPSRSASGSAVWTAAG